MPALGIKQTGALTRTMASDGGVCRRNFQDRPATAVLSAWQRHSMARLARTRQLPAFESILPTQCACAPLVERRTQRANNPGQTLVTRRPYHGEDMELISRRTPLRDSCISCVPDREVRRSNCRTAGAQQAMQSAREPNAVRLACKAPSP